MAADAPLLPPRRSRFWLFAPFVLLALVAAAWSAGWFFIKGRVAEGLDAFVANEAQAGRFWRCPDRTVGGYPFRIEVRCPSLAVEREGRRASFGRVSAVAQVYQPRHVIIDVAGPLAAGDGRVSIEGQWRRLRASIRTSRDGLQRLSAEAEAPQLSIRGLPGGEVSVASNAFEAHLRPHPGRQPEEAYETSILSQGTSLPVVDALLGGAERSDIALLATVTQARDGATRPWPEELERWRQAEGRLEITRFALTKGPRRLEAKADLGLDAEHRVEGRIEASAVGLEGLIGQLAASRAGAVGAVIGALSRPSAPAEGAALKPLPPIRLENGRVFLGPLAVPGLRLQPLY